MSPIVLPLPESPLWPTWPELVWRGGQATAERIVLSWRHPGRTEPLRVVFSLGPRGQLRPLLENPAPGRAGRLQLARLVRHARSHQRALVRLLRAATRVCRALREQDRSVIGPEEPLLTRLARLDPGAAELLRGTTEGDGGAAIEGLARAIDTAPAEALPPLLSAAFWLQQPALCLRALERLPIDRAGVRLRLRADALSALGRREEARAAAIAAWRHPGADDTRRLEALDALLDADGHRAALDLLRPDDAPGPATDQHPAHALRRAELLLWAGQSDACAAILEPLLAHLAGSDRAQALALQGGAQVLAGAPARALAPLRAALEIDDHHLIATLWLTEAHFRLDERARGMEVLTRFDKAITGENPIARLLHALGHPDRGEQDDTLGGITAYSHEAVLSQILGPGCLAGGRGDVPTQEARIWRALEPLGGCRGPRVFLLADDGPHTRRVEAPRRQITDLQHAIWLRGPEPTRASLLAHHARWPAVPFGRTYAAEIDLWAGRYEQALAEFDAIWARFRTRWGYVGRAACRAMLGRDEEALAIFAEREHDFLPAEASYAYRGEIHLRRGDLPAAERDLAHAVRARPSRVGAVTSLALLRWAQGREGEARALAERLAGTWPALWRAALRCAEDEALPAILRAARERLRGNRSSYMLSWFDETDTWRCHPIPPRHREDWLRLGGSLADALERDAWGRQLVAAALR